MVCAQRVPFPSVPLGEISAIRRFTAPGLFAYRYLQSLNFLEFPDFGDGDMTREQRREALNRMVNVHRPMAAVSIFLGVVGLEDYVRELGARLADVPLLERIVPRISELRPVIRAPSRQYARPDRDACNIATWTEVNDLYERVLGVQPFLTIDIPKLQDLALIRHTVAHHGSVVRRIDVPRFQHWEMIGDAAIDPPVEFVKETLRYLHEAGSGFERRIREKIFPAVLAVESSDWQEEPSPLLVTLVETFDWFGHLITRQVPVLDPFATDFEEKLRARDLEFRAELLQKCIRDLADQHVA